MASKELNSTDYIEHHLTNLTYGKCPDGTWSFAEVHGKSQVAGTEASCNISEMGFWAFQVDTLFMSVLLGMGMIFFMRRVAKNASSSKPSRVQNAVEYLVTHGHPLNVRDRWGATPLDEAKREKRKLVVDFLNKYKS